MLVLIAAASFVAAVPRYEDSWISAAIDWPKRGVSRKEPTAIEASLTVDTRGYVSDCRARSVAGNPNMAPYTCQLLKERAEFTPARDPSGHKIYGLHRVHLIWVWEDPKSAENLPVHDFQARVSRNIGLDDSDRGVRISYAVDASGRLLSCGPMPTAKASELTAAACGQLPVALLKPVSDRNGKPVVAVEDAVAKIVQ